MDAVTLFHDLLNVYEESKTQLFLRNDLRLMEQCILKLEDLLHTLSVIMLNVEEETLQELLVDLYRLLWVLHEELDNCEQIAANSTTCTSRGYVQPRTDDGSIGRPRIDVGEEEITYLRSRLGLSWSDIAKTLKISRRTVYRLKDKYRIGNVEFIPDDDLDKIIQEILSETPNAGEVYVLGSLRSRNLRIQRWRVRERIHLIDPIGRELRRRRTIVRRVYTVKGANYLWHIDSNHKLVNFRMVFHGCIDGYSRTIIYLKCINDNKATSVLNCFESGVGEFGLPSRVRGDRGTENIGVANFMIAEQGCDRGSFIVGRSVHNQRIERLWSEVNRVVSRHYKSLFIHMEEIGILDENNDLDLFCLSYIFMPRIRSSLEQFIRQWNSHALSSAGSRSPLQIWTFSTLEGSSYISREDSSYTENPVEYGVDYMGPLPEIETENNVVVPEFQLTFSANDLEQISNLIPDPLFGDLCDGVAMYVQLRDLIGRLI